MKKESGFTIIELLLVVVMIAILSVFGLPAMGDFVKNNRLTTQINTLVGHLAHARSEAVLRSVPVALCASSDMATCSGVNWAAGWIMFIDTDRDGSFDAGEEILQVKQLLAGNNTLTSTVGGGAFSYDSRGFSASGTATFSLCDDRGVPYMKSISISNTGRVRQGGAVAC